MKYKKAFKLLALSLPLILAACSSSQAAAVYVTATPPATAIPGPQVTVYYEGYAQFELISPEGTRVLIDVYDPSLLTSPPTADDVLLSTHLHGDHFVESFAYSFPGQEIRARVDELTVNDVTITSIASVHTAGETPRPEGGSNYIYVIDTADMRLVHFGDIGEEELSQEQLEALGEVDVAILLFGGMCSIDWWNSFGLMDQVQPRLIIPTHAAEEVLDDAFDQWTGYFADPGENYYAEVIPVTIGRDDLPDETGFLPLGEWATASRGLSDLYRW